MQAALATHSRVGATHASPLHRHGSIRLPGFDYTQAGAYFITTCLWHRKCLFGEIVDGQMRLNAMGHIVADCWRAIPRHFQMAGLDAWVAMPNHFHGIVWITDVRATHASPLRASGPPRRSLGAIVGSFKSAATKRINAWRKTPGAPVWQRNYHEHIIRSDESLNRIRQYILDNPVQWARDRENPSLRTQSTQDCASRGAARRALRLEATNRGIKSNPDPLG